MLDILQKFLNLEVKDTYISGEDVEKFLRKVSKEEIVANDYNLNILRYVDSSEKPDFFDIYATMFGGIPEKEIDELSEYWKACVFFARNS